jgi:hypothetical protein
MKLHEQVKALKTENETLREGMADLMRYLQSNKFNFDTTVQRNDVLNRIHETLHAANCVNY